MKVCAAADEISGSSDPKRFPQDQQTPQEVLIYWLNSILKGWANFHRHNNAKQSFNRLDSRIWWKLMRWLVQNHRKLTKQQMIDLFFNGGKPWVFQSPRDDKIRLQALAEIPILPYISLQEGRSWFDGDSLYWASRLGRYPGTPHWKAMLLQRQKGRCAHCHTQFVQGEGIARKWGKNQSLTLVHKSCANPSTK